MPEASAAIAGNLISSSSLLLRMRTLLISLGGVAAFLWFNLPLPWMLGALFACLLAALCRVRLPGFGIVSVAMRTVLGTAVGASVTPQLLDQLPELAVTLASMPLLVIVIGVIGYPYFRRVCGFDRVTAYFSAMPGGFQDMVLFGEEAGGDVRRLSLVHATRVLIIVIAVVAVVQLWFEIDIAARGTPGLPLTRIPWQELLIMLGCAVIGWRLALRLRVFGASIIGPMVLAGIASLTGLIHHRPPMESIVLAQIFIGLGIGVRYTGVTWQEVKETVLAGFGYTIVIILVCAVFFAAVTSAQILDPLAAALIYAPGGQAELALLALIVGSDVAVVVAHHLMRLLLVIGLSPLFARWLS